MTPISRQSASIPTGHLHSTQIIPPVRWLRRLRLWLNCPKAALAQFWHTTDSNLDLLDVIFDLLLRQVHSRAIILIGCFQNEKRQISISHHDPERWQSGRMHRTRNAAWVEAHRGFESPPLRQIARQAIDFDNYSGFVSPAHHIRSHISVGCY